MELREGSCEKFFRDRIEESPDNWTDNGADTSHKSDEEGVEGPCGAEGEIMIITDMVKGKGPSANPAKKVLMANAMIFCLKVLTPDAFAASSSSRTAIIPNPNLELLIT